MKLLKQIAFAIISIVFCYVIFDSIQHIFAEINHRKGIIAIERGYPKIANNYLKTTVDLAPWENYYLLQLAKSYESSAKKSEKDRIKYTNIAIKCYEKLIKEDPINPWFYARLGLIYHDIYKKDRSQKEAKDLAQKLAYTATMSDPKNPLFTLHYAHLLYNYQLFENAKKYYNKTIEYDHSMTEAHFNLAAIYSKEKNLEAAKEKYIIVNEQLLKLEKKYKNKKSADLKTKIDTFQNARIKLASYYLNKKIKLKEAWEIINSIPISIEKFELKATFYGITNNKEQAISIYNQLITRCNEKNNCDIEKYKKNIELLSQ